MEKKGPTLWDAIHALVGGQLSGSSAGYSTFTYHDGQTPPSEEEANNKLAELIAAHDALEYSRNRRDAYPDWQTQLNKIYDDGIDAWKTEMVDPVKVANPKPE